MTSIGENVGWRHSPPGLTGLVTSGTVTWLQGNQVRRQAASLIYHACGGAGARFTDPVAAVDDGGRFVGLPGGETSIFAEAGPPQDGAEEFAGDYGNEAEFPLHLLAQRANLCRHGRVRRGEAMLHGPDEADPGVAQGAAL